MKEPICPLIKKACLEQGCRWYMRVLGKDPQTGQEVDRYGCAVEWLPILLIETSKEVRQAAAATESLRNETVNTGAAVAKAVASGLAVGLRQVGMIGNDENNHQFLPRA